MEGCINQFTVSFVSDVLLNFIFVLVLSVFIVGFNFFKKSSFINSQLKRKLVLGGSSFITLVLIHLGGYVFDQSFFVFLGAIGLLSFYITFENYFEKKMIVIFTTTIMSVEVFIWQYFAEPIWSLYVIDELGLQILHSFIPIITIILSFMLSIRIKWFAIKTSLTIFLYFLIAAVSYTAYVSTNEIVWLVSVTFTTLYLSIVAAVSTILDRYFSSLFKNQLNTEPPKLGTIQKFNKAQNALCTFASLYDIKVAPFLTIHFPKLYELKKNASYRNQKKNILKYLSLVEKTIKLIIPNSKTIFFEAGYYETALLFTIPDLTIKDIAEYKGMIKRNEDISSLRHLFLIIKSFNNLAFQLKTKEGEIIDIYPTIGLAFYGYHGELFKDLLQQATVNLQKVNVDELSMFTTEEMFQKISYKIAIGEIIHIVNSPLIYLTKKAVIKERSPIGKIVIFDLKETLLMWNITNLSKIGKAAFYSQKMYHSLTEISNLETERLFITLPSSYFDSNIFCFNNFIRKIKNFEKDLNTHIEIIVRDLLSPESLQIIKELRIKGISFSCQKINEKQTHLFNYVFDDNIEYSTDREIILA